MQTPEDFGGLKLVIFGAEKMWYLLATSRNSLLLKISNYRAFPRVTRSQHFVVL